MDIAIRTRIDFGDAFDRIGWLIVCITIDVIIIWSIGIDERNVTDLPLDSVAIQDPMSGTGIDPRDNDDVTLLWVFVDGGSSLRKFRRPIGMRPPPISKRNKPPRRP